MFFRRGLLPLFLVGFFGLMLISGVRQARFQSVYNRGFQAGVEASSVEQAPADGVQAAPNPAASPHDYYGHHHHRHGIGFFGFLFYLIMFAFLFKVLRRLAWGRRGGRGRGGWHKHHYHNSGPWHPGFGGGHQKRRRDEKPAEKSPSDDFYEM